MHIEVIQIYVSWQLQWHHYWNWNASMEWANSIIDWIHSASLDYILICIPPSYSIESQNLNELGKSQGQLVYCLNDLHAAKHCLHQCLLGTETWHWWLDNSDILNITKLWSLMLSCKEQVKISTASKQTMHAAHTLPKTASVKWAELDGGKAELGLNTQQIIKLVRGKCHHLLSWVFWSLPVQGFVSAGNWSEESEVMNLICHEQCGWWGTPAWASCHEPSLMCFSSLSITVKHGQEQMGFGWEQPKDHHHGFHIVHLT